MSKSNVTGRIFCISNGTSYSTILQCDQGDLNQFYDDANNAFPVFGGTNTPKLFFFAYSTESASNAVEVTDNNITWTVNGVVLSFSGGVSTNSFNGETGHFKKGVTTLDGDKIQTLTIVKDLVNINNKSSFNIEASAVISVENTSHTLPAMFPVTIAKGEVGSRKVRIQSPKTFTGIPFTITKKQVYNETSKKMENVDGSYCQLEVVIDSKSANADSGFTYKWYKQESGKWVDTGLTSNIITVSNPDVEGSALYKVVVMSGNSEYGSDVQNVNDISDPYEVVANCVDSLGEGAKSAVGVCYKGSGVPVIYAPYVKQRDSGTKVSSAIVKFMMTLCNSVGTILNDEEGNKVYSPPFKNTDKRDNFTIPEEFVSNNNGIDWTIEAVISDGISN